MALTTIYACTSEKIKNSIHYKWSNTRTGAQKNIASVSEKPNSNRTIIDYVFIGIEFKIS